MRKDTPYILGLDLGTSSIGWAMIGLTRAEGGKPNRILKTGVRIFEAGVEGDIEQGKDSSRAAKRREARQPRRQNWRTQHRKKKLFEELQSYGLLPESETSKSADRKVCLDKLDAELLEKFAPADDHDARQKLVYIIRSKAAEKQVEPFELGRAIYSLAQRRGYLSNRKSQDDDEQEGVVKGSISALQEEIDELGPDKTLAQYFKEKIQPANPEKQRIRRRYTGRDMYRHEFQKIRDTQSQHHSLSDADWDKIEERIFFQRPLKSQKHLVGRCDLEPDERRCPECLPIFQEFRILQKVNDLRVILADETKREIEEEERQRLLETLQTTAKLTARQAAKAAGLPKKASFSLEEHDGLDLIGNRTNVKMIEAFGDQWLEFDPQKQEQIALEVLHYRKPKALRKRAMEAWGLNEEQARKLAKTRLEQEHARHSKKALLKLIEKMRDGTAYSTARKAIYPEQFEPTDIHEKLPPVRKWDNDIGNPAIIRALTELRKVVNFLIGKYGKPVRIHIEVARDLKNPRQRRNEIHKQNIENKKRREKAAASIIEQTQADYATRADIEKWQLAEECNWDCPYCGKGFGANDLIGSHAEFNVEHIFPRRYLDDSYTNKTIACRSCNDEKGDRTPMQAFSGDRFDEIIQRVKQFKGRLQEPKLRRFLTEKPDEDFTERHLNDTRYNAKLAANYLALLYGGRVGSTDIDEAATQRIVLPTGQLTGMLRKGWQLDRILGEQGEKNRDDHRHHAIDAAIVALSDQSRIQAVTKAVLNEKENPSRSFYRAVKDPWPGFNAELAASVEEINVSHRPTRTIAGPLHAESIYSKEHTRDGKTEYRIRKEIHKLSMKELTGEQIVDPVVRLAVQRAFEQSGEKDPGKAFADEKNIPKLPNKNGPDVPIRKVRISTRVKPRSVGKGTRERNTASGKDSNYASMVYAVLDKDGNEKKWIHEIITRLDAAELYSKNLHNVESRGEEKVLVPDEQDGKRRFKFALRKNDMLLLEGPEGEDELYRVQSFSESEIQLCEHTAQTVRQGLGNRTSWNRITSIDVIRRRNARVVEIAPDGEISDQ